MFSKHAWDRAQYIYRDIICLPFITELTNSSLAQDKLTFYLKQDSMYLIGLTESLNICASRTLSKATRKKILKLADKALETEKKLHQPYFREYNIARDQSLSPACFIYNNFLKSTAKKASFQESLVSLLPCVWIYMGIGQHLLNKIQINDPYYKWVKWYTSKEFASIVALTTEVTDDATNNIGATQYNKMLEIYLLCARFDYIFLIDAYNKRRHCCKKGLRFQVETDYLNN